MAMFTLAGCVSFFLSALVTEITLNRKHKALITALGWTGAALIYFAVSLLGYMVDFTSDIPAMLMQLMLPVGTAALLYKGDIYSKMFISVMASLIANITTFLFCGSTLSLIDNSYPYNHKTIATFIIIKVIWSVLAFLIYRSLAVKTVREVVDLLGVKMKRYLFIPLIAYVSFAVINRVTNLIGMIPGTAVFSVFYITVCINFGLTFFEIFSTALWNSRAEKTEAELSVASNIQRDMLPCIFPPFPDRKEFDIYATMEPAKEVGGDFYDFFMLDENRIAVVMADVSGKGVPAALFMVIAKTLIKNYALLTEDLGDVFRAVNDQLCENNAENMFVTAFMGVWDIRAKTFYYVNAGHNPPLIKNADGSWSWLPVDSGFVLAGIEGMTFQVQSVRMQTGQSIFLYTDGVTEALNPKLELYSDQRLEKRLNDPHTKNMTVEELVAFVRSDVQVFAAGAEQADDITMLGLQIIS